MVSGGAEGGGYAGSNPEGGGYPGSEAEAGGYAGGGNAGLSNSDPGNE